ncbi:MAG TPA: hypothetical protein DCF68_07785 [Cyanothece sp. UBA12306]|nr:hypothetical protein [Cyanothece sp. UBA12306]
MVLVSLISNSIQPNFIAQTINPLELTQQTVSSDHNRNFIEVKFQRINSENVPIVQITNLTSKNIDNIQGSFILEDTDGNYLFGSGYTSKITGQVFIKAGDTRDFSIFGLSKRTELVELIRKSPNQVRFFFEAKEIKYMDGTVEKDLQ